MRREHFATVALAIPLSNALSLANFQQITSILVPTACLDTYNSQIPSCEVDDFRKVCSTTCKRALERVGADVSDACGMLLLNPQSLLGIVKNGNIVQAICPEEAATPSPTLPIPTQPPLVSLKPPGQETPRPIPSTTNIQSSSTETTTLTTPLPSVPVSSSLAPSLSTPSSTFQTSISTSQAPIASSSTSTISQPSNTTIVIIPSTDPGSQSTSTSSTAAALATQPAGGNNNGRTGGGSPFDIPGDASSHGSNSILYTTITGAWIFLFFEW